MGLGFRVQGLIIGLRVYLGTLIGFRVQDSRAHDRVWRFGFKEPFEGFGFRVQGIIIRFRVRV